MRMEWSRGLAVFRTAVSWALDFFRASCPLTTDRQCGSASSCVLITPGIVQGGVHQARPGPFKSPAFHNRCIVFT